MINQLTRGNGPSAITQEQAKPKFTKKGISDRVSKSGGLGFLVAIGWLALAGNVTPAANSGHQDAQAQGLEKKPAPEQSCNQTGQSRGSSLCAEWKSADAAEKAAWWAMAGTLITALGTLGLYLQISLTRRAVNDTSRATEAMREANRIAKGASELELRPYVWFGKSEIKNVNAGGLPVFVVQIMHAGQTPAYEVKSFVAFGLLPPGLDDSKFKFNRKSGYPVSSTAQLFPGHEGLTSTNVAPAPIDQATLERLKAQTQRFLCAGVVSYRDIFGKRHLTTFKCVSMAFVTEGVMETAPTKKGNRSN